MIRWIEDWFSNRANNKMKEKIRIETIDNPGWFVEYELVNTEFSNKKISNLEIDITPQNWYHILTRDNSWLGAGGAENLIDVLREFKNFVEPQKSNENVLESLDLVEWIQKWYKNECNGDWEHSYGVEIKTLADRSGWALKIELIETKFEDIEFNKVEVYRDENDWIKCWIDDNIWHANCGPKNLVEALKIFKSFIEEHQKTL